MVFNTTFNNIYTLFVPTYKSETRIVHHDHVFIQINTKKMDFVRGHYLYLLARHLIIHTITKMNNNRNMDSMIAKSENA